MNMIKLITSFLDLFEEANSAESVSNEYEFVLISDDPSEKVISAISRHRVLAEGDKINVFPLNDWEAQILNKFPDSEEYWFGITPANFKLEGLSSKQYLIQLLNNFFSKTEFEVMRVKVDPKGTMLVVSKNIFLRQNPICSY